MDVSNLDLPHSFPNLDIHSIPSCTPPADHTFADEFNRIAVPKPKPPRLTSYQLKIRDLVAEELALVRRQLHQKKACSSSKTSSANDTTPLVTLAPRNAPLVPSRGRLPYCAFRQAKRPSIKPYRIISNGHFCACDEEHEFQIYPNEWRNSPAEMEEWDYALPNGGYAERKRKVRFAEEVVTEERVVERWYMDTYGPWRMSSDVCSEEDDEHEVGVIESLEDEWKRFVGRGFMRSN